MKFPLGPPLPPACAVLSLDAISLFDPHLKRRIDVMPFCIWNDCADYDRKVDNMSIEYGGVHGIVAY